MSENHSSEQVLEVSGAQNSNFLDSNPDRAIRAPEEANGYYDHDRVNQEPALLSVMGRAENDNDNDNGVSEEEEGGDFVDCSEELVSSAEKEAAVVAVAREESGDDGVRGIENGVLNGYVMDEQPEQQRLSNAQEYKDEREAFAREVAELRHGLKALINHQQPLLGENESGENDNSPLLEMIKECSLFVKLASEDRLQAEATMREIHGVVLMNEQEIGDLNARVSELSVSNDAAASYMSSVQNSLEVSLEKDRHVEDVANRMLASLASVGYQEESLEDSISGKIIQVEKGNSLLIEKYNQILSEIDRLRQCLNETGVDIRVQEGHGTICVAARDELLELKRKEEDLTDKVRHLEDENRKLVEQLDGHKEMVEKVNAELANTKIEVEQEKVRCANTKEKLTMAVTKGKALVQQRDSLKHSLADKTSELEKCLIELQEKSSALESAELSKEELVKSENLIASLQETLSERTSVLEKIEEIMSEAGVPEELLSMDIRERFRWLVDERNILKVVSLESQKLKDAFSSFDLPETVSSSDLEARVGWLRESFYRAKDDVNSLQDEIAKTREAGLNEIDRLSASLSTALQEKDYFETELADLMRKYEEIVEKELQVTLEKDHLSASLSTALQEKDYLQTELAELMSKYEEIVVKECQVTLEKDHLSASLSAELQEKDYFQTELANLMGKYKEIVEKEHQVSVERDQIVKMLIEVSGTEMEKEEGVYQTFSDNSSLVHRCFEKIKEQSSAILDSSYVNAELFERVQSLLYVRDHELMLCEKLLEEEMMVRSEEKLMNELKLVSEELVALKEEKSSLWKDLERSEEKSTLMDKLSNELKLVSEELVVLKEEKSSLHKDFERLEGESALVEKLSSELKLVSEELVALKEEKSSLQNDVERSEEKSTLVEKLSNELKLVSEELVVLKEENSSLQRDLERLEEKSALVEKLSNELKLVSEELVALKEENSSLQRDLERLEEKSALVEKLSNELKLLSEELVALKEEKSSLHNDLERSEEKSALVEKLSNELKLVYEELVALKEEKSSLQNDLERSEEKSTSVEKLSNELKLVSEELVVLKEEKSSLQKDLERSEEKSALVEKLSNELKLVSEELVELKEEKSSLWKDLERSEEKSTLVDKFSNELKLVSEELVALKEEKSSLQKDLERLEEKSTLVEKVSNELKLVSEELVALKEEKSSLQKDLERSEEKSALVREKLSMAVKKGKGLVQDRENLKKLLDEKNSEIQKLKLELQQQESAVIDCRDQIKTLSTDVEHIPKLEADLAAMKDQRDQLEQFLLESNKILQKVVESIDGIVLPVDTVFDEPVGKVNWLSGYINECLEAKTHVEQELGKVKEDANTLVSELAEAQATVKSLEDALSVVENNVTQLAEEKRELEVGKTNIEQELQKAVEEACSQTSKFVEAFATRKSLEEALSLAENNISVLFREKEEAQVSKTAAEMELEKVKEEVAIQTSKLTEAFKTIKSLEDSLSQVETNVALLTEQNNDAQVGRTNLENELKKLQEEAGSQANKLADSYATIKSLEDALLRAEDDISVLQGEKKNAEEELLSLNSKLNACMEELAGTSGSFESKSIELAGHLNDLQVIMKDETLLSRVKECFEKKFESLRKMDLILKNIKTHFVEVDLEKLQSHHVMEDDLNVMNSFSDSLNNIVDVEIDNSWVSAADGDNISSQFRKTVEGFQSRNKIIYDKVEGFSSFIDECIAGLLRKLQETQDGVVFVLDHIESLKQKSKNLEMIQQEQETTIAMLENDVATLLSACADATRELQIEVKNNLLELISVPELEKLNHTLSLEMRETDGDATVEQQQRLDGNKHVDAANKLLLATRKFQSLVKQFDSTSNVAAATVEELQNKLKQSRISLENAIEERDLNQDRVSKLESEVEELQTSCSELRLKLNDSHSKEEKLKEREAEISSLSNTLLMKEKEAEDSLLSASQVKTLLDKVGGIEIPMAESEVGDLVPHNSAHVKKLFYIIDTVTELQQQVRLLSHDKEELQSTITTQILEIEHLKEEVEELVRDRQDSEKVKDELSELTFGLEKIIGILGGELFDQKSAGVKGLLSVLEKQVVTMPLELENSKSKAQELGTKLSASQKVVDELSIKVKVLEDSLQDRSAQTEIVQERSIFEAPSLPTGSEISEIEDAGSLGQTTKSPVPPATVARTVRKGSAEHLAINVDVESERLINNEGSDEDKGHVFKSLNTSGLIPKQGKLIADRVDGIWVSGGRLLMSRPQARLGLIAYSLLLHIWLLATIL
ncbi:trans-Golgi network-localized SYP41-interacting protein 1 [Quercus robur]|uniref:trans-Golgi network-localized SYP41-interacting protein 1 n=1 Tax=Quercus robur TaxID=38942 RepID=UPI0021634F8F|nr:trans-Golgi network-localized SYP41-interacting protein 1 [Quercus robur]XP_050276390.1 trans-Golgi network-localized SYP41-interacting protein 1 [Quercus robur]